MSTKLILQGFRNETHLEALQQLLRAPDAERVILSVAYLNARGVGLVADELAALADRASVFAGIRNGVTSKQGLSRLLITGVRLFAVDTGAHGVLYHPKLYLSRCPNTARLLVGSANLTVGGLNNNIEAGVDVVLDLAHQEDRALEQRTEALFDNLPTDHPENVVPITTLDQIDGLLDAGRLSDEHVTVPIQVAGAGRHQAVDNTPRIRLAVQPYRRPAVPPQPRPVPARPGPLDPGAARAWERIWESTELTERDLNIPSGPTTHPTGSINLDKGLLSSETDHRHYFREIVFEALTWRPAAPGIEEADTEFRLQVAGMYRGTFQLTLSHTTSRTSPAYRQHNAMTRLRWGPALQHVAHRRLLTRSLVLFRNTVDPTLFLIEID